eukprot:13222071-Alexandrium_andersonii.AAC.1
MAWAKGASTPWRTRVQDALMSETIADWEKKQKEWQEIPVTARSKAFKKAKAAFDAAAAAVLAAEPGWRCK